MNREQIYRNRYLIAFAVVLASMLELIDSTIVNVAIPRMMGHLSVTLDEVTWVNTGYIVANVIVLGPSPGDSPTGSALVSRGFKGSEPLIPRDQGL